MFRPNLFFFGVFLHLAWSLAWTGLGQASPERAERLGAWLLPARRSTLVRQLLEAAPPGESLFGHAGAAKSYPLLAKSRAGALVMDSRPASLLFSWFEAGLASPEVHGDLARRGRRPKSLKH